MDRNTTQPNPGTRIRSGVTDDARVNPDRREFLQRVRRAAYLAPALTLLGSASVSAQGSNCPPGEPGCDAPAPDSTAPAAPEPPAPTE